MQKAEISRYVQVDHKGQILHHVKLQYAVNFLQRKFHRAPLLAVAYSAGGHVLLSYLQK